MSVVRLFSERRSIHAGVPTPTVERWGTVNGEELNDVPTVLGEE
jgi:hypothetical protein